MVALIHDDELCFCVPAMHCHVVVCSKFERNSILVRKSVFCAVATILRSFCVLGLLLSYNLLSPCFMQAVSVCREAMLLFKVGGQYLNRHGLLLLSKKYYVVGTIDH